MMWLLAVFFISEGMWLQVSYALPIARLRRVEPTVQLRNGASKSWVVARERGAIVYGDFVRTGDKGKADILFANGTKVAMRARSSIEIIAPRDDNSPLVIRVFGALSEVFVRPRGNTQVRTAAAIAAARGTEFLVRLPDENSTEVVVTEGSVDFGNPSGQVIVEENQSSTARVGEKPTAPVVVDVSGELAWTADVAGLPLEWRTPFISFNRASVRALQKERVSVATAKPSDARAQMRVGEIYHDLGEYSNAVAAFERATQIAPESAEAWLSLSRAERGRGNGPAALQAANRALALDSSESASAEARLQIALAQLVIGDLAEAKRVLAPIQATPHALAALGLIAIREGRTEEAVTSLRSALSDNQQSGDASLRSILALTLLSRNQSEEGLSEARRAVKQEPNLADAQSALASSLFFSGQREEAVRVSERAIELDDESPLSSLVRGRVLLAQGNTQAARDAFGRAYALEPSALTATEVGDTYLRLRQWGRAERFYRHALQLAPDYAAAHSGLGVALQEQGQSEKATEALQRARVLDPRPSLTRSRLAQLYYEQGDLERARQELPFDDKDLPATLENAILLVRLSELSLVNEDLMAAQNYARRAVKLLPQSGLSHYQLGRVYLEQGRTSQAEQQFRQAVILDDELDEARFALGYVREQNELGRDLSRPSSLLNSVNLGGASRAENLQNIRSAGAEDRIQATLSNPTVARSATRAFGDTQIDGIISTPEQNNTGISYLKESSDRRTLLGVTASDIKQDGDDFNSDFETKRVGFTVGHKNLDNNKGIFFSAQIEKGDTGLNVGMPGEFLINARSRTQRPHFLLGGFLQENGAHKTRFLLRSTRPEEEIRGLARNSRSKAVRSIINFELRHDWRWNERNLLTAGISAGRNESSDNFYLVGIPELFNDLNFLRSGQVQQQTVYLRHEFRANKKLTIAGQIEGKRLKQSSTLEIENSGIPLIKSPDFDGKGWEPKVVVDYRLNSNGGLRLRVAKTSFGVPGYNLLTPSDLFSTPIPHLPQLTLGGSSDGFDLEAYHSFTDSSFLRLILFQQNVRNAQEPSASNSSGELVERGRVGGLRAAYEGVLNKETTFFANIDLVRARDLSMQRDMAFVPRVRAEAGIQWLRPDGFFVQPSWLYSGSRIVITDIGNIRERRDDFQIFNLRVGKKQGLRATYFVEVVNIFDQPFDVLGVEQPGRRFRVGASMRF